MSPRFARNVITLFLALSAAGTGSAWADRFVRSGPRDGGLPASVRRVQRETGGEVLKAQPFERDGREMYRVKVLTPQGRIRVVEDEPQREDLPPSYPRGEPAQASPHQGPVGPGQFPRQTSPPNYPRQAPVPYQRQMPPVHSSPPHNHGPG